MRRLHWILLVGVILTAFIVGSSLFYFKNSNSGSEFSGERAYRDVLTMEKFGPRLPGSEAHQQTRTWIQSELQKNKWDVEMQICEVCILPIFNIIGKKGTGPNWIILGAHYDSRLLADRDIDSSKRNSPVPGANDGASGAAVLLEIARTLPEISDKTIWIVFFDAEDNGEIQNYDWLYGSRYFVDYLTQNNSNGNLPAAAIIIDMIGDADLNIFYEGNSTVILNEQLWKAAEQAGYNQFIPKKKYYMLDDHTPFLQAGIPAVDIIDFDYPYWHTTEDTADKVSAGSLEAVGKTLTFWLVNPYNVK